MNFITSFSVIVFLCHHQMVSSFFLGTNNVCYGELGCFPSGPPFISTSRPLSVVPSSPDHIRTKFILYTKDTDAKGQSLDARKLSEIKKQWSSFRNGETKLIVHGFIDDYQLVSWIKDMKDAILKQGDYNVVIVDWSHGNLPPYTQATANTRVVGAQIAQLIKRLQDDFSVKPSQVHIIGHSLGAHIGGYAGMEISELGRITGLDPAGPYFIGTPPAVRLDPTDAAFVDSIHTDAAPLLKLGLGMADPVGHADFYPNLGHDQPGCKPDVFNIWNQLTSGDVVGVVACNHMRSTKFFTESVNSKCPFTSYPCNDEHQFKDGKCTSCPEEGCPSMGFHADQHKPPIGKPMKYYLSTADKAPFCQYHVSITIHIARTSLATQERGTIKLLLRGEKGDSNWIELDELPVVYQPGTYYRRSAGVPNDLGVVTSLTFQWHHMPSTINVLKWNFLGLRNPKLYLNKVEINMLDQGVSVDFCPNAIGAESDKKIYLHKKCQPHLLDGIIG